MNTKVLLIELVFANLQTLSSPCRFSEREKKKRKKKEASHSSHIPTDSSSCAGRHETPLRFHIH